MRSLLAFLPVLFVGAPALAQSSHDPARLFPYEAPVHVGREGELHRLPLPAAVLEHTRPDLSDLRIHDPHGHEVPFLVDSGARPWPRDVLPTFEVTPVRVERRVEEGDSLAPTWREILHVAPPGHAPEGARWRLRIESALPTFVRSAVVRHETNDGAVVELARTSLYRFVDPVRERLSIPLPALPPASSSNTLVVLELAGEGGYLEPQLRFEATREPVEPPVLVHPLRELARERRSGSTWIELARPVGVAPDRLRVLTSTRSLHRLVRVLDVVRGEGAREIGRASVFRVQELEGAEQLEIEVGPARGETLRIEVADGDSPALDDLAFEAVVRQPVLVFSAPRTGVMLRFGGGRAHAPRYDVGEFAGTTLGESMAAQTRAVATIGEVRPNPRFDEAPALRFAMRAGRPVELERFTHIAPVTVRDAPEGLTELRLTPAVLSVARLDLADLRVIDGNGRQWPYLAGEVEERQFVAASVADPVVDDRRSTYVITPPVDRARLDRVVLHTPEPYLARSFVLRGIDDDGRRVELARGTLHRAPEQPGPLEIAFSRTRVSQLELVVDDGSDAPIVLDRIELGITSPSLFLAAPEGEYRLLAGNARAERPDYEIERARSLVLSVRAGRGTIGELSRNTAHVEPAWYESTDLATWIVWALLIATVLALGLVTFRLARSDSPPPPPAPPQSGPRPGDIDGPPGPEEDEAKREAEPVSF